MARPKVDSRLKNIESGIDEIKSKLGEITPYSLNKKLILSLDERWQEYFISKNKNFQVVINENRIMLIGPKVSSVDPTTKSPATKQETSDFD